MLYDYEEYFNEPSDVDLIMKDTKEKIHELLKDDVINIIDEYKTAKEELISLNVDIRSKQNEIKRLEKKIKELEDEYEKRDKYDMPRKYIDKFVRDITRYFAPGDEVFVIESNSNWVKCERCNGTSKVMALIDDEEIMIKCPKCDGFGRSSKTTRKIERRTIDNVHLKLVFKKDRVSVWTSDSVYVRGREYASDPKNIYKTYEEAEKALKSKEV